MFDGNAGGGSGGPALPRGRWPRFLFRQGGPYNIGELFGVGEFALQCRGQFRLELIRPFWHRLCRKSACGGFIAVNNRATRKTKSPIKNLPVRLPGQSSGEHFDTFLDNSFTFPCLYALVLVVVAGMEW